MKKILLVIPLVVLLAAGCNKSSTQSTNSQPSQLNVQTTPTPATSQTATPAPTTNSPSSAPKGTAVKITALNPSNATAGSTVTVTGSGFTATGNQVMFGEPTGRHHPDGSADNVIATANSKDGKTLTFTVPASGPSGILCDAQNHCVGIAAIRRQPGKYNVSVANKNGTSNTLVFTLK